MDLLERLEAKGPKRILALDGGGIRGALSLGYLQKIEDILRARHQNPSLRLCDYFDLIGGTSTGAIIAAALAIGESVADIRKRYMALGAEVFAAKTLKWWNPITWPKRARARFQVAPLEKHLRGLFGDRTLGDKETATGLCVVAKRADTASTWLLLNHPKGTYFAGRNENILLRKAVRASTAAPTYFIPEAIEVQPGLTGGFVDGGVSMANNPALQLLFVATLDGFPFHWPVGERNLMIVSVGTGTWSRKQDVSEVTNAKIWDWAIQAPDMLMEDATWQAQTVLQWLSKSETPMKIDRMFGTLENDLLSGQPLLTYLRYDAPLDENSLNGLGLPKFGDRVDSLRDMAVGTNVGDLYCIGEKSAERDIADAHFPAEFDVGN